MNKNQLWEAMSTKITKDCYTCEHGYGKENCVHETYCSVAFGEVEMNPSHWKFYDKD